MNTYLLVLILTFLITFIALLGFPFPYWFERWFIVLAGVVILAILITRAFRKRPPVRKEVSHEENP